MRLAWVMLLAACGGNHKVKPDAEAIDIDAPADMAMIDVPPDADPLATLLGTGLCVDKACNTISSDVHPYTPQFVLWADAASKRRWIYLPPGTQIDTSDPDHWVFPQGTKLWKEFTSGSTRVETRYIAKVGPGNTAGDWYYMPYEWNATNDDTIAVPNGDFNANGTQHDIPAVYMCMGCHENLKPSRVLGFQAIQLDWANPTASELDLDRVIAAGWLTQAPPGASSPHYPLPSDPNSAMATAALGYVHANCGHCHNPSSDVYINNGVKMVLRLDTTGLATVGATNAYVTAVNGNATIGGITATDGTTLTKLILPGDPDHSIVTVRFESTNSAIWMPALGHKTVDPTGDATLRDWITHVQ
jgi:hypothetical protein